MKVDCSYLPHLQEKIFPNQKLNLAGRQSHNLAIQTGRQSNQLQKHDQEQKLLMRASLMKTQHCEVTQKYPKGSLHKNLNKSQAKKIIPNTYRSGLFQSTHNPKELILVYVMYKEQKLSLFLSKGISFEQMLRKMYKEIYVYEKQTYSVSNAILKNLLYKITGFESIDNDILYDYQLKYRRGALLEQKFFVPFKQEDHKMPFKIYTKIGQNLYGGDEFLARQYSDGGWIIVTTIKKDSLDEEKINTIKKSLKNNVQACSLLLKSCPSSFNQINWLETKHYLIIQFQYSVQTLEQNLIRNHQVYNFQDCKQIFLFYTQWFAYALKQMVSSNVQNFKQISLKNIGLDPSDGKPKISVFDNVINCIDFAQKRKSFPTYGKRASEKTLDIFYYETYLNLIKSLVGHFKKGEQNQNFYQDFVNFLENQCTMHSFTFDSIFTYFSSTSCQLYQKQKEKNFLRVDYTSKLQKIVSNMNATKANSSLSDQETLIISEVKEEVQKLFSMENILKSQQRNETKSILQMMASTSNFGDLKKQNIGNLSDFKKEEERKYNLKKKERLYIQEILSELSQNENFIKTTKENNLASIEFYLKKSDEKVKKKIVEKIQTKYKRFLQTKTTTFQDDTIMKSGTHATANQKFEVKDMDCQTEIRSYSKHSMLQNFQKNCKYLLSNTQTIKQKNHFQLVSSFMDKQNFASQILSRLDPKNTSLKPVGMFVKNKLKDPGSSTLQRKTSKLEQLFINRKNYSKEEKIALKKKQYGIYLDEADRQFSKMRLFKKPKTGTCSK